MPSPKIRACRRKYSRIWPSSLSALKLIDAAAAQKTPLTAYYDNRYVDELEKAGFFKRLWQ